MIRKEIDPRANILTSLNQSSCHIHTNSALTSKKTKLFSGYFSGHSVNRHWQASYKRKRYENNVGYAREERRKKEIKRQINWNKISAYCNSPIFTTTTTTSSSRPRLYLLFQGYHNSDWRFQRRSAPWELKTRRSFGGGLEEVGEEEDDQLK